jgi:short-subunit dehydrogenase
MKQHGEGGWMVNVASMAGMAGVPTAGAYTATKVAVVGMSESWQPEMAKHNVHVAVLCPAFVKTRIHLSGRNRTAEDQNSFDDTKVNTKDLPGGSLVENGIDPELVGMRVVEALQAQEFYIFTHPSHRESLQMRGAAIDQAFERAAQSPILADIEDDPNIVFG